MQPWDEQVSNSAALAQARAVKQVIDGLDPSLITNETKDYIERTELVVDMVIDRLSNTDPRLISVSALNSLGSSLANVNSHLTNWVQGGGTAQAYLTQNAQAELDTVLTFLIALAPGQDVPAAREAVTSLRRSVARNRTLVEHVAEEITQKGTDANATIDQKVAGASQEFTSLEQKVTALDGELQTIKSASTQVTTEQQTAFTKAEADRSTTFNKLVTDKQKELEASLDTFKQDTGTAVEAIRKNVEDDEKAAAASKARVEEILNIVGEEALVGDYSKNAKEEQTAADTWRIYAALSVLSAIAVAIWLAITVSNTTAWQHVVAKIVVVLSFGGLAGYAAQQSSEHRTAQRKAERMALQLKALKPYLNDIEDSTKRDELLAKIADRLFGQEEQPPFVLTKSSKNKNDNPMITSQLLEIIIDLLKQGK